MFQDDKTQTLNIADFTEVKYEGVSTDWLEISRIGDEHSSVLMLDCFNNDHIMSQDKPVDWIAERPNGTPHFLYNADFGFDATYSVEGDYTGTIYSDRPNFVYWSEKTTNKLGIDCWAFFMPNEPVTIKTKSTERTTYLGKDFVGVYKGYQIYAEPSLVVTSSTPSMTLELKSNGSYTANSTDNNEFKVNDMYTYDEANQTFEYVFVPRKDSDFSDYTIYYGVRGQMIDGFCFIDMVNKIEDKPEKVRHYCLAKGDFSINYAVRDIYGTKYLVEAVTTDGTKKYFFLDNYVASITPAELNFLSGENIMSEGCKAIISLNGTAQWMYKFDRNTPSFIEKGKEAGTYKPESGEAKELVLDGFGNATVEGASCTYTLEGTIVTLTVNSEVRLFMIDTTAGTYKEIVSDEWDGPEFYENVAVPGQYSGTAGTDNTVRITFNKNLVDKDAPGKAALKITMRNEYGSTTDIVAAAQKYIYDAANKTVTLTNILMGDANGFNGRKNITFKLSDDMTKLYLEGTGEAVRIYRAADPTTYVEIDLANALVGELAGASLAPKYEGGIKIYYYGSPMPETPVTLAIDKDPSGADKAGYASLNITAMGSPMFDSCVEYTYEDATLTLKGVTVGDGNYGETKADIVFTVEADGSLQGSGKYYGPTMNTAFMEADFSTCKLTAVQ